jgi:hypothetical protein
MLNSPVTLIASDSARADRPTVRYLCVDRAAAMRVIANTSLEFIAIEGDAPACEQQDAPEQQEEPG